MCRVQVAEKPNFVSSVHDGIPQREGNPYLKPVANNRVRWWRRRELDWTTGGRTEAFFFLKVVLVFPYKKDERIIG